MQKHTYVGGLRQRGTQLSKQTASSQKSSLHTCDLTPQELCLHDLESHSTSPSTQAPRQHTHACSSIERVTPSLDDARRPVRSVSSRTGMRTLPFSSPPSAVTHTVGSPLTGEGLEGIVRGSHPVVEGADHKGGHTGTPRCGTPKGAMPGNALFESSRSSATSSSPYMATPPLANVLKKPTRGRLCPLSPSPMNLQDLPNTHSGHKEFTVVPSYQLSQVSHAESPPACCPTTATNDHEGDGQGCVLNASTVKLLTPSSQELNAFSLASDDDTQSMSGAGIRIPANGVMNPQLSFRESPVTMPLSTEHESPLPARHPPQHQAPSPPPSSLDQRQMRPTKSLLTSVEVIRSSSVHRSFNSHLSVDAPLSPLAFPSTHRAHCTDSIGASSVESSTAPPTPVLGCAAHSEVEHVAKARVGTTLQPFQRSSSQSDSSATSPPNISALSTLDGSLLGDPPLRCGHFPFEFPSMHTRGDSSRLADPSVSEEASHSVLAREFRDRYQLSHGRLPGGGVDAVRGSLHGKDACLAPPSPASSQGCDGSGVAKHSGYILKSRAIHFAQSSKATPMKRRVWAPYRTKLVTTTWRKQQTQSPLAVERAHLCLAPFVERTAQSDQPSVSKEDFRCVSRLNFPTPPSHSLQLQGKRDSAASSASSSVLLHSSTSKRLPVHHEGPPLALCVALEPSSTGLPCNSSVPSLDSPSLCLYRKYGRLDELASNFNESRALRSDDSWGRPVDGSTCL